MTTEERNYPVVPMNVDTLARRRDHAQRNPWGNTAEMVGHIDWQEARIEELADELEDMALAIREFFATQAGSPEEEDAVDRLLTRLTLYDLHHGPASATAPEVKP